LAPMGPGVSAASSRSIALCRKIRAGFSELQMQAILLHLPFVPFDGADALCGQARNRSLHLGR